MIQVFFYSNTKTKALNKLIFKITEYKFILKTKDFRLVIIDNG